MTLLTTIQKAADLIGIPRPTAVVSSTDQQVRQLYTMANEELDELSRGFQWQVLVVDQTFVTVAASLQTAFLPTDWSSFVPDSMWNRSITQPILGPISEQDWQILAANVPAGPSPSWFRVAGNSFYLLPVPSAGQTVGYSYVSLNTVLSNASVPQTSYLADDDVARLPERIISLGIRWRFKAAKGLDYAEDMRTYEREKAVMQAKDRGMKTIQMSWPTIRMPGPYVQEGSWPL